MRTFLLSAAIALVGLGIADEAQAQRGRGRGFGGGWGGWGGNWGGIGYNNFGYGRGYGGLGFGNYGYSRPYWGNYGYSGYGYRNPWYTSGYSYGYPYYSSGYSMPYYSSGYSMPYYSSGYSMPYYNNNFSSSTYLSPNYYQSSSDYGQQHLASDESVVIVRVSDPNARILFDGQETQQRGTERTFFPPKLEPGTYHYSVTASFNRNGSQVQEQRDVKVVPGQPSFVDFTQERPAEQVSSPK